MSPRPASRRLLRGVPRVLELLIALALTLVMTLGFGPARAWAEDNPQVTVRLTRLDPSSVAADGTLTLAGTVTNEGSTPITDASVQLWRDKGPITNVDALNLTLEGSSSNKESLVDSGGGSLKIAELAAGSTLDFTLTADFSSGSDALAMLSPNTVYVVGVNVLSSSGSTLGSSRVLMPYPSEQGYQAATVAELASAPSMVSTGSTAVFSDDHLSQEIAPGGRLDLLADLAATDGVTAVIDPLLWDELTAMTAGYSVRQTDGSEKPGTATAAAAAFLARLRAIAADGRCYRSLYGVLNLQAAHAANRPDLLAKAIASVPATHPLASLQLAVLPAQGSLTAGLLSFMAPADPAVVLTDSLDVNHVLYTAEGAEKLVAVHSAITSGGPGPQPTDDAVHRIGRLQAEQLLYSAQGSPAVSVVDSASQARAELASASGRHRVTLQQLLSGRTATWTSPENGGTTSAPQTLVDAESGARATESLYTELSGNTSGRDMDVISLRAWSSSFTASHDATTYLAAAVADIQAKIGNGAVSMHISSQVYVPTEATQLPVSLSNTMKMSVHVRVLFQSDNPARITFQDTDVITLDPGESATVRVSPRATGNGTVSMSAVVATTGATARPLGQPVDFLATANSAGRIGWIIIIGSGVVLLGTTALRVRQVRHERAHHAAQMALGEPSSGRRAEGGS